MARQAMGRVLNAYRIANPGDSEHEIRTESLAEAYWDEAPLDRDAVAAMVANAPKSKAALCIESFSNTSVSTIRDAVGPSAASDGFDTRLGAA